MIKKEIDLHLTNRCNFFCKHCVFSSGKRLIKEMSLGDITKIIQEFATITHRQGVINLFGGEPLLRKDIFKIIKIIIKHQLKVGITTNCQLPEGLLRRLIDLKIDRFTTNLDGAAAKTHDWLRNKKGNFEKVIKTLKYFVSQGTYTTVNSVIHKDNIHEIVNLLELGRNLKINGLAFYFFTPTGRGLDMLDKIIPAKLWLETEILVINWIKNNHPKFSICWEQAYEPVGLIKSRSRPWRCEKNYTETVFIRCDGEVYTCALLEGAPCSLGNLKKDNLKTILKRRRRKAFIRKAGCPALAFHVYKDLDGTDPRTTTKLINLGCPYEYKLLN